MADAAVRLRDTGDPAGLRSGGRVAGWLGG
jgi:hypothetical protein